MKNEFSVSFIGSGNVATQLALSFKSVGHKIKQIYSKSYNNASELAQSVNAEAIENFSELNSKVDFIIISTNDDSIKGIAKIINSKEAIVIHTSGSVSADVLSDNTNFGVLYPLQTLSKNKKADFNSVPILIEGNSNETIKKIELLAKSISANIKQIDSNKRKSLHLSAVVANNFSNHIFTLLRSYCSDNEIDFELLQPLIDKTISENNPQTGPAKREDTSTLNKHIEMLESHPEMKDLYKSISNHILAYYGHKTKL